MTQMYVYFMSGLLRQTANKQTKASRLGFGLPAQFWFKFKFNKASTTVKQSSVLNVLDTYNTNNTKGKHNKPSTRRLNLFYGLFSIRIL